MGSIPVLDCLRCGNHLLMSEIKALIEHCAPCRKLIVDQQHKDKQMKDIYNANKRGGM